jgi:NADPH:quinone reductase-like Zn-dependent oxidoreductase
VVFDLIGGGYGERSLGVLRPGGVLVTAVDPLNRQLADQARRAGVIFRGIMVEPDRVGLEAIAGLVDDGRLSVHVERTFSFDDVAEAHRLIEGGHVSGKVVLVPQS